MFERLERFPVDPILGLISAYNQDPNPHKVDLGAGVYKDASGNTPIPQAVKRAEQIRLESEKTKAYFPQVGNALFNAELQSFVFGGGAADDQRLLTVQTPGGSGAVKIGSILLGLARPGSRIWVSEPTWNNHAALLSHSNLNIVEYPYYDRTTHAVRFEAMLDKLNEAAPGDSVLLHGCCHNPCGADLTAAQWQAVAECLNARGLFPYVDLAYHGLARDLDSDVTGVRLLREQVPEMLVAYSCSKNFGLYRDRVGALTVMGRDAEEAGRAFGQVLGIARRLYSVPPSHGPAIVAAVLGDASLKSSWMAELETMRGRLNTLRAQFSAAMAARQSQRDFSFISRQFGLFSLLGLTREQVLRLRNEYSVYMVETSRINIAGINAGNLDYLADAVAAVL